MSKVAQPKSRGTETQILKDDDLDSSLDPKGNWNLLPKISAPNTYRELPPNDLIWWGMSILSTFVVVETFVVGTAVNVVTQSLVGAFQFWVQHGSPSIF